MNRGLLAGSLLALTACPAPADVTPLIHVDPRAAQRLGWFGSKEAPPKPAPPPSARVHTMKEGEQLRGPSATGRVGDLVLQNAEVVLVVAQVGIDHGVATTGGCIVDAADATARQDELGGVCAYLGGLPTQDLYDAVTTGTETDGTAWVEAHGHTLVGGKLALATRYTLHPPDRAVLLETSVENTGDAPLDLTSMGDAVAWGNAERVAPGKSRGFQGESQGAYVGGVGHLASYALTSTEGSVEALSRDSWTYTSQRGRTTLAPHEKAAYARILVVGARPDTSSLVAELALAAGQPVGEVKVTVGELLPGTKLDLVPEGAAEALTLAAPYSGVLPVGRYSVRPLDEGGPLPVLDVKPDTVAELTLRPRPAGHP
ncbi:MAG TPA: hypothetical protein VIF09_14810 [Polyangiaceae bacterium]|jgi:hypothetical protein